MADVSTANQSLRTDPPVDGFLEKTLFDIQAEYDLTPRELEILHLIVAGKTNKEIARDISRTERTVEYHRNQIMKKCNAHTAADLVKRALAMGLT